MRRIAGLFLTFIACASVMMQAQAPGASTEGKLRLDVVVTDKAGAPVTGLTAADFQLFDNGKRAQIRSFRAIGDAAQQAQTPTQIVIVLDMVNMPFDTVASTRLQIETFLRKNNGHLLYPVSMAFLTNGGLKMPAAPSTDGNQVAQVLEQTGIALRTIDSSAGQNGEITRFNYSVRIASAMIDKLRSWPGRKLLIWAGPGWPMLDEVGMNFPPESQKAFFNNIVALNTEMRQGRISLYSFSLGTIQPDTYMYQRFLNGVKKEVHANPEGLALEVLAVQSGGRVIVPSNDITQSLAEILQDAGTCYEITFDPPQASGPNEYRDLKVQIDKPELTARTNTGYYNQPESAAAANK